MEHKSTPEVCAQLGISAAALNSWLSRHERYKPKRRNQSGFLWSDAEVTAIAAARASQSQRKERASSQ
jgi:hypothetical protein